MVHICWTEVQLGIPVGAWPPTTFPLLVVRSCLKRKFVNQTDWGMVEDVVAHHERWVPHNSQSHGKATPATGIGMACPCPNLPAPVSKAHPSPSLLEIFLQYPWNKLIKTFQTWVIPILTQIIYYFSENYFQCISYNLYHQEFDARAVVRDHPHGKRIEDQYNSNKTLTPEMRVLLVKIIVSHVVQKFGL